MAFDLKAPTKRHKMYDKYKANRKGMPNELAEQMPMLKEILQAMNITIIEKEGSWVKLFYDAGFLSTRHEEVLIYRIFDISLHQSLFDKIFGVGTISLYCKDESMEYFDIIRVKNPFQVREIIADLVEQQREEKGFRIGEFHG